MRPRSILAGVTAALIFLVIGSQNVRADVYLSDGGTHTIDFVMYDQLQVLDSPLGEPTTVNLVTGGVIGMPTHNVLLHGHSRMNIYDGLIGDDLIAYDESQIVMSGGEIAVSIAAVGDSRVWVSGGLIHSGNSQVSVSGGAISDLQATGNGQITFTGGAFNYPYGTFAGPDLLTGTLTGVLSSGDPLNINFTVYPNAKIVLVPDPLVGVALLRETIEIVADLDLSNFARASARTALVNKLQAIIGLIEKGFYQQAFGKLRQDVLPKTDGCVLTGRPDKNDWITTCEAQQKVYPLVLQTMQLLGALF
jgi:hypothetical protein